VPDPDAESRRNQVPAAPSLFDPRDRTASRIILPTWAVAPIVWPDVSKPLDVKPTAAEIPVPTPRQAEQADAGGWRAVRP
jgi:hypothetical protein